MLAEAKELIDSRPQPKSSGEWRKLRTDLVAVGPHTRIWCMRVRHHMRVRAPVLVCTLSCVSVYLIVCTRHHLRFLVLRVPARVCSLTCNDHAHT